MAAIASLVASGPAIGASSSGTVVGATVPSSAWLDPAGCATGTAGVTAFGSLAAGASTVTPTDCVVKFGSSNDTSMLRAWQVDGGGTAMRAGTTDGVISHWPLNGSWSDVGTLNNPLVPSAGPNDPEFGAGKPGLGSTMVHDGDDVAMAAYNAAYDTPVWTIDVWFRTTNTTGVKALVNKGEPGSGLWARQFLLEFDNGCSCPGPALKGMTTTTASTYAAVTPAAPLQDGAWHHAAYVVDATPRQYLYVDGVLVAQNAMAGTILATADPVRVGHHYWPALENFVGDIDEVRIQNVARSAAEIRMMYAGTVADYNDAGGVDWATPGASFFGACLRDAIDGALAGGTAWTEGPGNTCPTTDGAHWQAIPGSSPGAKIAYATASDAQGGATDPAANLRFGFRSTAGTPAGIYSAPVVFEVVAPNA